MTKFLRTLKKLVVNNILKGPKFGTKRRNTVKEQEEEERKILQKKEKDDRNMIKRILLLSKEEDNFDKVIKNITKLFFSNKLSKENLIYLLKSLKQGEIYNVIKYIESTMGIEKKREFEQAIQSVYPRYNKTIPLTISEYQQFSHPYKYVDGIKENEIPHERYSSGDYSEYYTEEEPSPIQKRFKQQFINAAAFNERANSDFIFIPNKFDVDEGKFKPLHYDEEPFTVETLNRHKNSRKRYINPFFKKGGTRCSKHTKRRRR